MLIVVLKAFLYYIIINKMECKMAFTVQLDDGSIVNANSMVTVQEFYDYSTDRNHDYTDLGDFPLVVVQAALIRATDYLRTRYLYNGQPVEQTQGTPFPRSYLYNLEAYLVEGIPMPVKFDTFELTRYLLDNATIDLYQNVTPADADVKSVTNKADVLMKSIEYFGSKSSLDLVVGLANNIKSAGYLVRKMGMYI